MDNVSRSRFGARQWFALTAVILTVAAVAGVQSFLQATQATHGAVMAAAPARAMPVGQSAGIDMTPIGVIKSKAPLVKVQP